MSNDALVAGASFLSSGFAKKLGIAVNTIRATAVYAAYRANVHDVVVFDASLSLSFAVALDAAPPKEKPGNVVVAGAVADAGAGVLGLAPNGPPPSKPPAGAAGVADAFAVELAGAAAVGAEPNNPPEGATAGAIWRNVSE